MTARTVLAAAASALLAAATAAEAGPLRSHSRPRACRLVLDERGDADRGPLRTGTNPFGNEPAYDILSADVVADDRTLTVAVRVVDIEAFAPSAPLGIHWRLDFDVEGSSTGLYLQAFATPFGERFDAGHLEGGMSASFAGADVTGVLDPVRDEVRISVPVEVLNEVVILGRGSTLQNLRASSGRFYNTLGSHPSVSERTDQAISTQSYVAGTPSCVPVGR